MTPGQRGALVLVALAVIGLAGYGLWRSRPATIDPTDDVATDIAPDVAPDVAPDNVTTEPGDTADIGSPGSVSDGSVIDGDAMSPAAVDAIIAQLRTDPPARDPAAIARRMGRVPAVGTLPRQTEGETRQYRVGDVETFRVHDIPNNRYLTVQAQLEVIAEHAYLWVQDGQPFDRVGLEAGARAFDGEIYPKVRAVFGSEWTPGVDKDPRLHILHTEPIAGIAGFYSSADESPKSVDPNSNAREMFYVNLQTYAPGSPDYLQLLAHEFQHMIHWHHDVGEPVWVNEGLSEVAPYIAGYGRQDGAAYLANPDVSLVNWEATGGNNGPHYGASFLFFAWLRGLYGDQFLTDLVKAQGNGANGVDEAVRAANVAISASPQASNYFARGHGCGPRSFDEAFECWAIANVVRSVGLIGFGYAEPGIGQAWPQPLPPGGIATTVQPYGVDYWDITSLIGSDGHIKLSFEGDPTVPLLPNVPDSHVWWSNSADSMDSRLTRRFDFRKVAPDIQPTLTWRSWYALEDSWDYAYLMASTDGGATWRTVPTRVTHSDNPNGNNLGDGFTGSSGGWIDESADLTAFAGQSVDLAFEVITDDAVSLEGWAIDNIALDAVGFSDDAEAGGGWEADGWLRIDPVLPQRWSVQGVQQGTTVDRIGFHDDSGDPDPWSSRRSFDIDRVTPTDQVIVIISAMTPGTRQSGAYRLWPTGAATPVEGAYPGPAVGAGARDGSGTGYP